MYSIREGTEVLQHIDDAHDALITAVAGLSDAQSHFKPAPEAWSVAGIVEHLAIVEDRIVNRIYELLASAPEVTKPVATKEADEILKHKGSGSVVKGPDSRSDASHRKKHCRIAG